MLWSCLESLIHIVLGVVGVFLEGGIFSMFLNSCGESNIVFVQVIYFLNLAISTENVFFRSVIAHSEVFWSYFCISAQKSAHLVLREIICDGLD